jgi:hypothetical protein
MSKDLIKLSRRNTAEQNKKVLERALWTGDEVKQLRESVKARFGIDIKEEPKKENGGKFPVLKEGFSFGQLREKLREANGSSNFSHLLRAGIQTIVNDMYHAVTETTYEEWCHVVASTKDEELYAPIQGIDFPGEVGPREKFGEAGMAGLNLKIKNRKFGEIFAVEKELLMNDQTGQVQGQVALMAEYARLIPEILAYGKLQGLGTVQYGRLKVPASETKPSTETNYPWSQALVGGGKNRPAAFTALSGPNLQAALIGIRQQLNLLGLKMLVKGTRILASPFYEFDIATILNSAYYPSGAQAAGVTGGAFAQNSLKGVAQATISDFMPDQNGAISGSSKAWYLVDDRRPFMVVQMREAASVVQEAMDSGESFERDVMRWRLSQQSNADWIDPRFAWQQSDGSV